ncbi:MAG: hypothetical protein KF791_08360 [Verrucomicrobiae bacterium]|nr:hypothetical protein [Verrucomicrobiae bacterium]
MKRLQYLLLLLPVLTVGALGQGTVPITGRITTTDPSDTFATTDTRTQKGGFQNWFAAEGDWENTAILPMGRREPAMIVCSTNPPSRLFQLTPNLTTWIPLPYVLTTNGVIQGTLAVNGTLTANDIKLAAGITNRLAAWGGGALMTFADVTPTEATRLKGVTEDVQPAINARAIHSGVGRVWSFGDSITWGSSPSAPVAQNNWNGVVANSLGLSLTNLAYSSACIPDIAWQAMPGFPITNAAFHGGSGVASPTTITTNDVSVILTGYNDARDNFAGDPSYITFYRNALAHVAAWLGIPTSAKRYAQTASSTGSWINYAQHGGAIGRSSSVNGSTLTWTNLMGRTVYIGYLDSSDDSLGSFTVTVDGVSRGTFACNTAYANRAVRSSQGPIPNQAGPNGDGTITQTPVLARISGLDDTTHTVVITVSALPVTILWAGGSGDACAAQGYTSGPSVWIGGTLRCNPAGSFSKPDQDMGVFTKAQRHVAAALASDGLRVQHVPAGEVFSPSNMSGDNVHPNSAGHAQIAQSFLQQMGGLRVPNNARRFSAPADVFEIQRINAGTPVANRRWFGYDADGTERFGFYENGRTVFSGQSGGTDYQFLFNPAGTLNSKLIFSLDGTNIIFAGHNAITFGAQGVSRSNIKIQWDQASDRQLQLTGNLIQTRANSDNSPQNLQIGEATRTVLLEGTVRVGTGSPPVKIIPGTATWDPPSLAAGEFAKTTVSVPGATVGRPVMVGLTTLGTQDAILVGKVSVADTAEVILRNVGSSTFDLSSGTVTVNVWQQ